MGRTRARLAWWLALTLLCTACTESESKSPSADGGDVPSGPLGRIQGRVELTDGAGLGGVSVAAGAVTTRTDELGIFVLDTPVGQDVSLTVESDYYTRAQLMLEVIENSTVSASLKVLPLKTLTVDDVEKDSTVKGDEGFVLNVPGGSLRTKDGKKVTGKAEVRYAVVNEPEKMSAAPGGMKVRDDGGKSEKLEGFGLVEVRFYKEAARLSYDGPATEMRVPMQKDHGLGQGDPVVIYHFDEKEEAFETKGEGAVVGDDAVVMADEFSFWCAARVIARTSCVTGRVVDASRRPAPLANVELVASQRLAVTQTTTGSDGRFCLESIADAPHVLRALSALDTFSGREQDVMTGAEAASCGSDACLDLGDVTLRDLLFEAATPARGSEMDGGVGTDAGSDGMLDAGMNPQPDSGIVTPLACDTPIWLNDPTTCSPDLVADGGTATFALDGQPCAALWLCAEAFNRITLQIDHDDCMRTLIYGPNATGPVYSGGNRCSNTLIDDVALNARGPHLIVLEPNVSGGTLSGNFDITLWSVGNDPVGTAALDGQPVQIAITDPGQNGSFTFAANAGDRIALTIQTAVVSDYTLRSPTGLTSSLGASGGTLFSDSFLVNETGTYTVLVNPRSDGISDFTFQVFRVPADPEVVTTVDKAEAASLDAFTPGQNGSFTFDGVAGQRIAFVVAGKDVADFALTRVNGTENLATWAGTNVFSDVVVLEETGPYRLNVNPRGQGTGTYTLTLWSVPADLTVSTKVDAASGAVLSLTTPGQNGSISFAGSASQRIALRISAGVVTDFALWPPLGTQNIGTWATGGVLFSDVLILPQSGSYTLTADPRGQGIDDDLTVEVFSVPVDLIVPLSIGAGPSQMTITRAGQNGEFTFNVASAPVTVTLSLSSSGGVTDYQLRTPTGTTISSGATGGSTTSDVTLNESGTYRILVNPRSEAVPVLSASVAVTGG